MFILLMHMLKHIQLMHMLKHIQGALHWAHYTVTTPADALCNDPH